MPTTYAHYRFGCDVKGQLKEKEAKIINDNIEAFDMGVYGPDILFYYRPLIKTKTRMLGSKHHHQAFEIILKHAAEQIKNLENPEKYMAYMYGFICHFALDAYCHGYINYTKKQTGLGHNLMEAEFDRMLMEMDGHNPLKFKPTAHMKPSRELAAVIGKVYIDVDEKTAYRSTKTIKAFSNIIAAPTIFSRALVYTALFLSGNLSGKGGMVIRHKKNAACDETNKEIYRLYQKAEKLAVMLIGEFEANVFAERPLSKVCRHTLSTEISVEEELDKDAFS